MSHVNKTGFIHSFKLWLFKIGFGVYLLRERSQLKIINFYGKIILWIEVVYLNQLPVSPLSPGYPILPGKPSAPRSPDNPRSPFNPLKPIFPEE